MAGIGALMGPLGGILSGVGTVMAGIHENAAAKFEAKQMKVKGDAELAKSQREAIQSRKEKDLVLSRQKAIAASSGGGASDQSVDAIFTKTEQQGEYNAMMDMYSGFTARDDLYRGAAVRRQEGKSAMFASFLKGGSTIFSSFAT